MIGTLKFFNANRGFGFITREDGGPDAFLHATELAKSGIANLNAGDRISFDTRPDRKGGKLDYAVNIALAPQ